MTVAEEQKRLNQEIARELDKYQVMLEYGRIFLDRDKRIRDGYKWVKLAKRCCLTGAAIDIATSVITGIFSSEVFNVYIPIMLGVLALTIIIYVAILYKCREQISHLIEDEDRIVFEKLMDDLQSYLHHLGEWIKDVDSHIKQKKDVVDRIKLDLAVAKSKQANDVNRISKIQGDLDASIDKEAHRLASLRLEQFRIYIYENEQKS